MNYKSFLSGINRLIPVFAINNICVVNCVTLEDEQSLIAGLFALCCGTEDLKEGASAFLEKRKPVFKKE